jgi:hypothetical protein
MDILRLWSARLRAEAIAKAVREQMETRVRDIADTILQDLPKEQVNMILLAMNHEDLQAFMKLLTSEQLVRFKRVIQGKDAEEFELRAGYERLLAARRRAEAEQDISNLLLERAEYGEEFVNVIQKMMYAAGDAQDSSPYCAVMIKDAVGSWMRQVVQMIENEPNPERKLADTFPSQYAVFHRWLIARSQCKDPIEEDEEVDSIEECGEDMWSISNIDESSNPEEIQAEEEEIPSSEIRISQFGISIGGRKRLESIAKRTLQMSAADYQIFSNCRSISFMKKNQKGSFCKWIGYHHHLPTSQQSSISYFLAYLAWDRLALLVEAALGLRIWTLYRAHESEYKTPDLWLQFSEWRNVPLRIIEAAESIRLLNHFAPLPISSTTRESRRSSLEGCESSSASKKLKI